MRDKQLDILFEPLDMPNLKLKNRFFMAPLGTTYTMSQLTHYFVARAKGEVGLITTGEICVHPSGRAGVKTGDRGEIRLETDDDIGPFVPMVTAVKDAGAKIVAQLNHAGRYSPGKLLGQQAVAPSAIASRYTGETPRELTTEETDDLVIAFAEAARRAREAGFDGIEILGCSGYLVSEFLSPLTNKREDKYGGDTLQRGKFLFSMLREIRKRVGDDFNICVKYDAEDGMEGGKTLEDSLLLAPRIVEAGADRLHIWAGWHEATRPMLPMSVPRGAFTHLAAAVGKTVDVPISTVGRINDPILAAEILEKGDADLIGIGRAIMCDPDFVKKTMEGKTDEIRRCTACCYCFDQVMLGMRGSERAELKCSINPEMGREGEGLVRPAEKKKHVAIAGGGPAGMEAARVAALRGHRVTLFEAEDRLGGMINLAVVPPHKEELQNIIDYYARQLDILDVDVRLNTRFHPDMLEALGADALVVAAGARELVPEIPGIEGDRVVSALDVLRGDVNVGQTVVIIGGGLIGLETAEFLVEQGKKVTVVEMRRHLAEDVGPSMRWALLARLRKSIRALTERTVAAVEAEGVVVEGRDGADKTLPADTVVLAAGLSPRDELALSLSGSPIEVHVVGSCREPGQIAEAVDEGFRVGIKI
ncbi:MAG: FAD-dependent oxidoreductase [Deltaproteobacteria bacterium]|nr:FAD-dependent oxidoreductase [Deltaproteobacteria bacterium]